MKLLNTIFSILTIVALFAIMGYVYIRSVIDSLIFDFKFRHFDLNSISSFQNFTTTMGAVATGGSIPVDFDIDVFTTNYSDFSLKAKIISLKIFFNGIIFAETEKIGNEEFVISPYTTTTFNRRITAYINANNIHIIDLFLSNQQIPFTYEATLIWWGFIFTTRGIYVYDSLN